MQVLVKCFPFVTSWDVLFRQEPATKCWKEAQEVCSTVSVSRFQSMNIYFQVTDTQCKQVPHETCQQVPKKRCNSVPHEVCTNVPETKCWLQPSEKCSDEPVEKCQKVPEEKCWQVGFKSVAFPFAHMAFLSHRFHIRSVGMNPGNSAPRKR